MRILKIQLMYYRVVMGEYKKDGLVVDVCSLQIYVVAFRVHMLFILNDLQVMLICILLYYYYKMLYNNPLVVISQ